MEENYFKKQEGADYVQVSKSTLERAFQDKLIELGLKKEDAPDSIQEKTTLFRKVIDDAQLNERNPKQGYHWEYSEGYLIAVKKQTLEYDKRQKEKEVIDPDKLQEAPVPEEAERVEGSEAVGAEPTTDRYVNLLEKQIIEKDLTIKDLRETNKFLANSNNSLTATLLMLSPGKSPAEEPTEEPAEEPVDEKKQTL